VWYIYIDIRFIYIYHVVRDWDRYNAPYRGAVPVCVPPRRKCFKVSTGIAFLYIDHVVIGKDVCVDIAGLNIYYFVKTHRIQALYRCLSRRA